MKIPIPYDELDPEIVDVVRLINDGGFPTFFSCQGGEGHGFPLPTVLVRYDDDLDETRKALCRYLIDKGVEAFSAKTISMHQRTDKPESYSYIEITFWTRKPSDILSTCLHNPNSHTGATDRRHHRELQSNRCS